MLRKTMGLVWILTGLALASEKSPYLARATAGVGGGSMGPTVALRLLGGTEGSTFRYGLQATAMQKMVVSNTSHSEHLDVDLFDQVGSINAVVGWELSPKGPFSVDLFLGPGVAHSSMQRPWAPHEFKPTSEGTLNSNDPSLLAGVDLGVSLWRHVGLSLQLGALASKESGVYALLQLDAGKW